MDDDFKRLLFALPDRPLRNVAEELADGRTLEYRVPIASLSPAEREHFNETNRMITNDPVLLNCVSLSLNSTLMFVDGMPRLVYSIMYAIKKPSEKPLRGRCLSFSEALKIIEQAREEDIEQAREEDGLRPP
jgi:hypothetical protein